MDINQTDDLQLERPMRFYIQAKIQKPVNKKSADGVRDNILAKMVVHNLLDHMELSPFVAAADISLSEVFMVLYNWGETSEEMILDVNRGLSLIHI